MGQFGFSYVGLVFLLALFIPNLFWTKNKPKDYDPSGENRVLLAFERGDRRGSPARRWGVPGFQLAALVGLVLVAGRRCGADVAV